MSSTTRENLPGGLELRPAEPGDLDQVAALLEARGDPADAVDMRLVVGDPDEGLTACGVVVDGARVVSTATLLRETVVIEGVPIPAGQVEMVATEPAYEGRGLVRALMDWAHQRSADRGDLLQVMIGIPYFYRQFGYAYAMPIPLVRAVVRDGPAADPAVAVRRATVDDIGAMAHLQDEAQSWADVRVPHSPACWRWLVARDGSSQLVAERDGHIVGTGRMTPPDEGVVIAELAGEPSATASLVAHARALGPGAIRVVERPGATAYEALRPALAPLGGPDGIPDWFYARVDHLGPLLQHIAPVLVGRLERAGLAERRHDVLLSSWRSHVRFSIGPDGLSEVTTGGPEQGPVAKGGSGVPPDAIAPLLLGPDGATGLEQRLPDCWLGRQRELMSVLFPPMTSDLLTFYLAV